MITISYRKGCRTCFEGDPPYQNRIYTYSTRSMADLPKKIAEFKGLTEFEMMKMLSSWSKSDGHSCMVCGGMDFDFFDIVVDGYKLYSFDRLAENYKKTNEAILILNFKKNNDQISIQKGGTEYVRNEFLIEALIEITGAVALNGHNYGVIEHEKGHFNVTITGLNVNERKKVNPKIQTLAWAGIGDKEVSAGISYIINKHGLSDLLLHG